MGRVNGGVPDPLPDWLTGARRVSLEPAFLLHHYPWRDTSRILELLTRTHGRVSVIARASRQSSAAVGSALRDGLRQNARGLFFLLLWLCLMPFFSVIGGQWSGNV